MIAVLLLVLAFAAAAVTAQPDPNCVPADGFTRAQCSALGRRYLDGTCTPTNTLLDSNVPVVWLGNGCPKPCVARAKAMGRNPARYCKMNGQDTTWKDGGCQINDDVTGCAAYCEDVCERSRFCKWEANVCQPKTLPE